MIFYRASDVYIVRNDIERIMTQVLTATHEKALKLFFSKTFYFILKTEYF